MVEWELVYQKAMATGFLEFKAKKNSKWTFCISFKLFCLRRFNWLCKVRFDHVLLLKIQTISVQCFHDQQIETTTVWKSILNWVFSFTWSCPSLICSKLNVKIKTKYLKTKPGFHGLVVKEARLLSNSDLKSCGLSFMLHAKTKR